MDIVHVFNQLMSALNWAAVNIPWDAVVASGLLTGVLAGPQKLAKKWFKNHEPVIITVIGIVGPAVALLWAYVLHHYGTDPKIVLLQGLGMSFMTQPFYFIVWKPWVVKRLWPAVVRWFAVQMAAAVALNETKTAVEPAGGLQVPGAAFPTSSTVGNIPLQDFKQP